MTLKNFFHFIKLHAKTIGILAIMLLVFILVIISAGKSSQIQKLLLQIKQMKVQNDVDVLSHTINTNNDSIKDLDKMNTAAQDTISQVVVKNQEIQKKIEDKKTDLNDLAKMFDSF